MNKFVKGNNSEAKFSSIEQALQKFSRRLATNIGTTVPPVPVSIYQETPQSDGRLLNYMFPAKGEVEKVIFSIDEFPEENRRVPVLVKISSPNGETISRDLEVVPTVKPAVINMEVSAGSKCEIFLKNPEIEIQGIWIAFTYHIHIKQAKLQSLLADEIEKLASEVEPE